MTDGTERSARYSDPVTERGGFVGRGAVLYDTRDPQRRPCCNKGGRCLAHVTGVFEETSTGEVYYRIADGTWTTDEWINQDDLLALFEPAGWSVESTKPTYILSRECGVEDHHDLMTDGGQVDRPDPEDDPFVCSLCGVALGTAKRISGDEYCDRCQRDIGMKDPLRRCEHCGTRGPEEQMKPIDISAEDEYYPEFVYLCPGCANGGESSGA